MVCFDCVLLVHLRAHNLLPRSVGSRFLDLNGERKEVHGMPMERGTTVIMDYVGGARTVLLVSPVDGARRASVVMFTLG